MWFTAAAEPEEEPPEEDEPEDEPEDEAEEELPDDDVPPPEELPDELLEAVPDEAPEVAEPPPRLAEHPLKQSASSKALPVPTRHFLSIDGDLAILIFGGETGGLAGSRQPGSHKSAQSAGPAARRDLSEPYR
jgi:outer membrane biosynthesis protein TonB